MNIRREFIGCVTLLFLIISPMSWANTATYKIKIEDVNKGSTYTLEHKFEFKKGGKAQRKHFEVPGNDYSCTLAFFELNNGTMLSCEYKHDIGQTFFQSDRSGLNDKAATNNLTFRHKSSFISIETKCK